jgi:hypothetical protein
VEEGRGFLNSGRARIEKFQNLSLHSQTFQNLDLNSQTFPDRPSANHNDLVCYRTGLPSIIYVHNIIELVENIYWIVIFVKTCANHGKIKASKYINKSQK